MSEETTQPPQEEPRDRFRRLLSETEEEENQLAVETEESSELNRPEDEGDAFGPASQDERENVQSEVPQAKDAPDISRSQPADTLIFPVEENEEEQGAEKAVENPPEPAFDEGDTVPVNATRLSSGQRDGQTRPTVVSGQTPQKNPSMLDRNGFPLPRRVNEIDVDATRVTPTAYAPRVYRGSQAGTGGRKPPTQPPGRFSRAAIPPSRRKAGYQQSLGCLLRGSILGIFGLAFLALIGVSFLLFQYYSIAKTLPDIRDLRQRASQFETTKILDRNGNVLYEILDPNAGRRTYVSLDKISPYLVAATVATEDKGFYSHPGVDIFAIARAFWQNYQSGETVSGASTITQQLARTLFLSPEERNERSYQRKIREAILATEITRRYSKDEILELYLNESYYGNLAYGVEAAAETYFGTTASQLTLAQAAFLAGLPQAPSVYDVYTNRDLTLKRQENVLVLMYEANQEEGCIYVSNNPQRICLDPVAITNAANELKNYQFHSPDVQIRYPHWVNYVRSLLENQFDAQTIYRSGFTVYTTLDPGLQDMAQKIVQEQVATLADKHATDGALVAMRPSTGEILAMVGSADFYNEAISGQVNMAVSPRQPGSSIKPITYLAAFEKGWTPSTLIWDVPSEFPPSGNPDDTRPPYKPVNYDGRFHGPVTVRTALANSYNIPAVKTLDFVGIYDNPDTPQEDGFISLAKRLGITTLTLPDYGLSLTLGGGEVTLLQLTNVYATFANSGLRIPPVAITRILDHNGNVVYDYQQPQGDQVMRPEDAYLITSILSDNDARTPSFGPNSVLNLPFQAAAKTGTTNDFRDNWTMGYTPDLAVGVWVGNADFTPMQDTSGLTGAAPIWSQFMQAAEQQVTGGNPRAFTRPGGIVEHVICAVSGTEPSQWCPKQRTEVFAADQPPLPKEDDLWQKVLLDTWTNLRASPSCSDFTDESFVLNVTDPWAIKWIKNDADGKAWVKENGFPKNVTFIPSRECNADDPHPKLSIISPKDGDEISASPLDIYGVADATKWFDYYELDYGVGDDPVEWKQLEKKKSPVEQPDILYEWDLQQLVQENDLSGPITLRLYLHSTEDTYAKISLHLNVQVPTPTPTPTATPTATPTPTETPTPTMTPVPTSTPTETSVPLPSLVPSLLPTKFPKATPEPTRTSIPILPPTMAISPTAAALVPLEPVSTAVP